MFARTSTTFDPSLKYGKSAKRMMLVVNNCQLDLSVKLVKQLDRLSEKNYSQETRMHQQPQ